MLWYGQVDLVPSPKSSVMLGYSLPVPRLHSWLLWLLMFLLVLFCDANYLVTFISLIFMQISKYLSYSLAVKFTKLKTKISSSAYPISHSPSLMLISCPLK